MTLTQLFTSIANAIRTKKGTESLIQAEDFADEISTIETGIDTSDATAEPINIRDGETAYVDGQKITGILPVLTYPVNPISPTDYNYQFIASTSTSEVTRDGTDYLLGTYQIASQSQPDSWMFEGNRKMKMGVPVSRVVSIGGITASKIKKGETIYGVTGTYEGSGSINIFVQNTQPSGYNGIWINSSNTYNNIVEVSSIENLVASSINIVKGTDYETILFESFVQNGIHYKFNNVHITDQSNNIVHNIPIYYGNGSSWINLKPYIALEYIQSTGSQYINTNFKINNNTNIEYDGYAITEAHLIGTTSSTITGLRYEIVFTGSNQYRFQRRADNNTNGYILLDANTYPANIRHTWKMLKNKVYVDNTLITTFTNYDMSGADRSLCVFALNRGSETSASGQSRCYGVKIYQNNLLAKSLIPAKRKSNNAIGMYDIVNNTFYANAGTGTFTAGPVIS